MNAIINFYIDATKTDIHYQQQRHMFNSYFTQYK